MKIWKEDLKKEQRIFITFQMKVGPFSLPFTKGFRFLNGDNQPLEVNMGRNATSHLTCSSP